MAPTPGLIPALRAVESVKRTFLINLALALVVTGLVVWMTLKPGDEKPVTFAVSDHKAAEVNRIRVERQGLPVIVLQRDNGRWHQTEPFKSRTDNAQAGRLLDLLAAQAKTRYAAEDLARFELDAPFAKVTFDTQEFAFGTVNALTGEQYVMTEGRVYLVSAAYAYGLPTRADSLASHMLLGEDEIPVALEFPGFELRQKDGRWAQTPPPADSAKLSEDDYGRRLDQWRFASAVLTRPMTASPKGETGRILLKDGRTVEIRIVSRQPQLILARPDENLEYVLAGEGARLLEPLNGDRDTP